MAFNAYFKDISDGIQTVYVSVSWDFKSTGDILEVTQNGVVLSDPTEYTFNGTNTVTLASAPALDDVIIIRRVTQVASLVDYLDGTGLTEADLDLDKQQTLDLIEEIQDTHQADTLEINEKIGTVDVGVNGNLQDQILALVDGSVLSKNFTVTIPSQGRLSSGDLITLGTSLEDIIIDMLQQDTPPVFSLAGSGAKTVESGTLITPTLTPSYTANDAGPSNNYDLRKNAGLLYNNPVPAPYIDAPFNIVDTSVSYQATVDYDANIVPAGSLVSNTITYTGARAAFHEIGGDPINIRTNNLSNIGVGNGTSLVGIGDGVSLTYIWAYPATLSDPNSLFLQNTGGNFDITSDLVVEAQQLVNDAVGANPVMYKVFSYTGLIPIKVTDTLTLTI